MGRKNVPDVCRPSRHSAITIESLPNVFQCLEQISFVEISYSTNGEIPLPRYKLERMKLWRALADCDVMGEWGDAEDEHCTNKCSSSPSVRS